MSILIPIPDALFWSDNKIVCLMLNRMGNGSMSKTRSCDGQQKPNLDRAGQSRTRAKKMPSGLRVQRPATDSLQTTRGITR